MCSLTKISFLSSERSTADTEQLENSVSNALDAFEAASAGEEEEVSSVACSGDSSKKKKVTLLSCLCYLETKYDVVVKSLKSLSHCKIVKINEIKEIPSKLSSSSSNNLLWTDCCISSSEFLSLRNLNLISNHYLGMSGLSRKNNLSRNLNRIKKLLPDQYKFFPKTFTLPSEINLLKTELLNANKTFIVKPDNQCQGKGIFLVRNFQDLKLEENQGYVAQKYLTKPFLLDGYKFDLRLYILVFGTNPLRIFLHDEGLVRLCTTKFNTKITNKSIKLATMHLTNYALNVKSDKFQENQNPSDIHDGHKRSLKVFYDFLRQEKGDATVDKLQESIELMIVKTLMAIQPQLSHMQRTDDVSDSGCFEILGFDVLLDHKLKPWLLEVNHAPSFGTDSKLDVLVKSKVLKDMWSIVFDEKNRRRKRDSSKSDRTKIAKERCNHEDNPKFSEVYGGFKKLYPTAERENKLFKVLVEANKASAELLGGKPKIPFRVYEEKKQERVEVPVKIEEPVAVAPNVGDCLRVKTSRGYERVKVLDNSDNLVDIEFDDGHIMKRVSPNILVDLPVIIM
jgi:Tubulin-tyrosine ligase family